MKLIVQLLLITGLLVPISLFAQRTVSGQVLSAKDGQPLAGATVTVKGSTAGTSTNADGRFTIKAPEGSTLVVSAVGHLPFEISSGESLDNIKLSEGTNDLTEVIVTGYTSQRKKDITGAVSVVKAEELISIPAITAENQLQGRAAGVNIVTNSAPGQVSTVRIRGYASFTGNDPLYIVDGVPLGSLLGIVSDDIESMQVLKDAASASIYGSRASNGVIIVTTKKGKVGPAKVSYNMYYGLQDPGKGFSEDLLNPQEWANLEWLAKKNSGQALSSPQYGSGATPVLPDYLLAGSTSGIVGENNPATNPDLYDLNYNRLGDANYSPYLIVRANKQGTNWWKELTRTAPIQNHNLTVSGASADKSRYLFSVNYLNQEGIIPENYFKRYGARINTEFNVKENIRIGENLQVYAFQYNGADNNTENSPIAQARSILPIVPVYTIVPGDFAGTRGNGIGTTDNPLAIRYRRRNNQATPFALVGNLYAEVDFLKNFTARTSYGGVLAAFDSVGYPTIEYEGAENDRNLALTRISGKFRASTWTNTLVYKNTFGDHNLQVLAGSEYIEEKGDAVVASKTNFFSYTDFKFMTLSSGTSTPINNNNPFITSLYSLFGKVDYMYKDRYIFSATFRRDGSSKFGSATRFGNFPAVSLGWRISEEDFFQSSWITDLKIRGSWGKMGNQRIATGNQYTQFRTDAAGSSYDLLGTSNNPASGFWLSFLGNINGQWETNTTSNIGFDALLFNNKTEINFDFYTKNTSDLLFPLEQPAVGGAIGVLNPPFVNVGKMNNWGIDLAVIHRADFGPLKMEATWTFTTYKNEITEIAEGTEFFDYNSPLNEANRIGGSFTRNQVGHPINSYYGYDVIGLFKDAADVSSSPEQTDAAPGRFKYRDVNGDKAITPDDRTFFGDPNPAFTSGLNLDFKYKNFDAALFFFGVAGRDAVNYARFSTDFYQSNLSNKHKRALYDSWTPDRPNATVPIQETTSNFSTTAVPNSYYLEKAGYLRMRNLSFGYTLPKTLTSKIKVDRFRLYAQVVNVFTLTDYTGLDPEVITTDDRAAGIDAGVYPAVRQYIIGVNLNF